MQAHLQAAWQLFRSITTAADLSKKIEYTTGNGQRFQISLDGLRTKGALDEAATGWKKWTDDARTAKAEIAERGDVPDEEDLREMIRNDLHGELSDASLDQLYVMPRPAPKHTTAASRLGFKIGGPFDLGERGPGGWRILIEPELRFPDPSKPGAFDALVPDLADSRLERLPVLPSTAYFSLAPDWLCEVLSTSTEEHDREVKMPVYAREGVRHAWLIDPLKRTLEVYTLGAGGTWGGPVISRDVDVVRAPPFDAVGLDLSALWT